MKIRLKLKQLHFYNTSIKIFFLFFQWKWSAFPSSQTFTNILGCNLLNNSINYVHDLKNILFYVKIIKDCGFKVLEGKRKFVRIKNKIELKTEDGKLINIKPSNQTLDVKFTLNYEKNPLIKTQTNKIDFVNKNLNEIIDARTFCLYEDIEIIKSMGLAKGGSLDNAIVVQGDKVLNKGGLRSKKEFVNHKILDLVGDFMLSGARVIGSIECIHGGHALTNEFLKKIFSSKNNYDVVESQSLVTNVRKIIPLNKRFAVNA